MAHDSDKEALMGYQTWQRIGAAGGASCDAASTAILLGGNSVKTGNSDHLTDNSLEQYLVAFRPLRETHHEGAVEKSSHAAGLGNAKRYKPSGQPPFARLLSRLLFTQKNGEE